MSRDAGAETRSRIIEAAGRIFADKGFHRATVRGICGRAGVNVALVAYHFGGKEGLYREVLAHALAESLRRFPPPTEAEARLAPRERIRLFVRGHLARIRRGVRPGWGDRLLRREFFEISPAMEDLVRKAIQPMAERLNGAVRELLDLPARDLDVLRCCTSVVGQCLHHVFNAQVVTTLHPEIGYEPGQLDALADHITEFSLAGIAAVRARREGPAGQPVAAPASPRPVRREREAGA